MQLRECLTASRQRSNGATRRISRICSSNRSTLLESLLQRLSSILQSGTDDLTRNVLGELLVLSLKQEAFHQLRTQQQLGYIVVLTALSTLLVRSVAFILQSTNYAAETLEQRCEKFLEAAADIVRDLSDSDFESYVSLARPRQLSVGCASFAF